jgi:hypothetical protein
MMTMFLGGQRERCVRMGHEAERNRTGPERSPGVGSPVPLRCAGEGASESESFRLPLCSRLGV